jgi:uncharacterized repeat protein (TIGR01451 family)
MRLLHLFVACVAVGAAADAQPIEPPPLRIEVLAEQLVTDEVPPGHIRRRFEPARQVRPYEEVYYTVRVQNSGDRPIYPVVVTRPVPENTAYVGGSAVGPAAVVTFSVDGGHTFALPAALRVSSDDGSSRDAGPPDYTHIRWELGYPLAAGATAILRFRVMLRQA